MLQQEDCKGESITAILGVSVSSMSLKCSFKVASQPRPWTRVERKSSCFPTQQKHSPLTNSSVCITSASPRKQCAQKQQQKNHLTKIIRQSLKHLSDLLGPQTSEPELCIPSLVGGIMACVDVLGARVSFKAWVSGKLVSQHDMALQRKGRHNRNFGLSNVCVLGKAKTRVLTPASNNLT